MVHTSQSSWQMGAVSTSEQKLLPGGAVEIVTATCLQLAVPAELLVVDLAEHAHPWASSLSGALVDLPHLRPQPKVGVTVELVDEFSCTSGSIFVHSRMDGRVLDTTEGPRNIAKRNCMRPPGPTSTIPDHSHTPIAAALPYPP